ncbi:lipopolysaccharide transport periplasmic protein LptA [Algibacillus agarilyticus]|uniref:lipopolysaccharide transport periplasmic protein LptA n=1 Tax=Algibacillus agarilyticus TaxID=2234133 RepID=UPI000DCFD931|nr:lipopolysaccharide transport periplasmic protein LptA [Algibacillus agarilyticus]
MKLKQLLSLIKSAAFCLLLGVNTFVHANLFDDENKESILIEANRQAMDLTNNTLTFYENVKVEQGGMTLLAEQLDVVRNKAEQTELLIAQGAPASFSHKLETGEVVTAESSNITFNVNTRILTLVGDAKIAQADSQITGDKIEYDVKQRKLVASSEKNQSRVRTVLTPN